MATSVGVVRKGIVVKDQGFVPYSDAKKESTPSTEKGTSVSGTNTGMGAAIRGGKYTSC
jgi:hypothetical protein|tara:strand:- start:255 stop:431 length:177 start_codon:yes stop_codon:yes gene_type:complete